MNRVAVLLDLDHLLVVNCSDLDARVLTELFLIGTDGAELSGYWGGISQLRHSNDRTTGRFGADCWMPSNGPSGNTSVSKREVGRLR